MMKLFFAATTALVISVSAMSAQAQSANEAAFDKRDNVVTNTFGNCVRTKWDAPTDVCAPEAPKPVAQPAPAPAPAPAPRIGREARTIYFEFDKAELTPDAKVKLDALASHVAGTQQIIGAGIAGFADRMGTSKYNLELSKERAKSVYEYLSQRVKINTQILDIRALGDGMPQTNCDDKLKRQEKIDCLAADRRVEVVFKYKE